MRNLLSIAVAFTAVTTIGCNAVLGDPHKCREGTIPNDALQECVIPPVCDGGTVNDRNECVLTQGVDPADSGEGGAGTQGGATRTKRLDAGVAGGDGKAGPSEGGSGGGAGAAGTNESAGKGGRDAASGSEAGAAGSHESTAKCGDGKLDPGEKCDGDCKSSCPAPVGCVGSELKGSAETCDAECVPAMISALKDGDGCCPSGATHATDMDCPRSCGDGQLDGDEKCEPGSSEYPCPTVKDCDDADPCTMDMIAGSAQQCTAQCAHVAMTRAAINCDDGDPCTDDTSQESPTECKLTCMHKAMQPTAANCADADSCTDDTPVMSKTQCAFECPHKKIGTARLYYADCDGDGYAAAGTGMQACSEPPDVGGCAWTERAPTANATDCDDSNAARHPGADFGLPISRVGQALPPAGDQAYDLDCDGVLTKGTATTLSTGVIKQGKLELIDLCASTSSCSAGGPVCAMSFPVTGGSAVCGEAYPTQTLCGGNDINVYFLCR